MRMEKCIAGEADEVGCETSNVPFGSSFTYQIKQIHVYNLQRQVR